MAERDKIRELAESLGNALCDEDGCYWNSSEVERILRAELKTLLDKTDAALLIAHHAQGECDRNCTINTCGFVALAVELEGWRKD